MKDIEIVGDKAIDDSVVVVEGRMSSQMIRFLVRGFVL